MLKQDEQAKVDKFIETMPTIIQTYLIIAPNWEEVTKKAKNLEHIMHQCEPPAIAPPISQGTGAVPSLYSHIELSQDQDSASIPKPFKSARGCGGKKSKDKAKQQQQPQPPPPPPEGKNIMKMEITTTTMRIIGETIEAIDHIGVNMTGDHTESLSKGEGDNKITIEANFKATMGNLILPLVAIIIITMVIIMVEVAIDVVATFIGHVVVEEAITEAITTINTINITPMMMELSMSNMVHHAHFVEVSIIPLNTVSRENMISIIFGENESRFEQLTPEWFISIKGTMTIPMDSPKLIQRVVRIMYTMIMHT